MMQTDRIREYAKRTPVFDAKSVIRLVGDASYAYLLLNHLAKRGEIRRLTKGYYTTREDPSLLVYCLKPAYLGLQDAMSFHNLWEQETVPVIITIRKIRAGLRNVLGSNVKLRRISREHFFGYDYFKRDDILLPVSDIEKTFIDMVYFKEIREDMLSGFHGRIDRKRILEYLKKYDKKFASKVLSMMK